MDKRRSQNLVLRAAIGFALAIVLVSVFFARAHSLDQSDVPVTEDRAQAAKREAEEAAARREATLARERTGLARLVELDQPLFCGGRKPYAALTFDDGPSERTDELVRILRRAGLAATFFVLGDNSAERPRALRSLTRAGAVMNHSWSHPDFRYLNKRQIRRQIRDSQRVIERAAGVGYRALRPPYGARDAASNAVIKRMGYAQILWSTDTEDARGADWQTVGKKAVDGLGPGAIVLMHDGPATTATALRRVIIPAIKRSRLKMVTLPELMALNRPSARQIKAGAEGCRHAGKSNVSGDNRRPRYMR